MTSHRIAPLTALLHRSRTAIRRALRPDPIAPGDDEQRAALEARLTTPYVKGALGGRSLD